MALSPRRGGTNTRVLGLSSQRPGTSFFTPSAVYDVAAFGRRCHIAVPGTQTDSAKKGFFMSRYHSFFVIALLVIGISFEWNSTRANDDEKASPQPQPQIAAETTVQAELLARIDALERRIARLEDRAPLIRQADNSESDATFQTVEPSRAPVASEPEGRSESTNGQAWRFRLLGHRQPATRIVR
jgi:hypothetical protein